jgi:ABC-2 type transport system permease protein
VLKIRTIINKEWAEVFKNRLVLFTVIFMPFLFTVLPLLILFFTRSVDESAGLGNVPEEFAMLCADISSGADCLQYYLISQFMILFMLTPVIVPVNIAAYSIVGEKTTHSLEPLLATPISTIELLIGKNLAAVIPAIAATWIGFIIFLIGTMLITDSSALIQLILDPLWLTAILVVGPLLSILSVNFAIMVSSRVTDPRVAEQLSVVVILPVMLLMIGQISGFLVINQAIMGLFALGVFLINIILIPVSVRLFERENILTRWK